MQLTPEQLAQRDKELAQARAEIERLKQCIEERENGDTMHQEEFENLCAEHNVRPSNCCAPKYCALAPFHEIELLGSEKATLRAQLEQMSRSVTDEEWTRSYWTEDGGMRGFVDSFIASRRARLLQPKTVEERVTITLQEGDFPYVVSVDGKKISAFGYEHSRDGSGAADFRLRLIAKLKAEGTISREAGGNAQ